MRQQIPFREVLLGKQPCYKTAEPVTGEYSYFRRDPSADTDGHNTTVVDNSGFGIRTTHTNEEELVWVEAV